MKTARKYICLLLVLAMVSAWMPAQVLAVQTADEAKTEPVRRSGTVTVLRVNPLRPQQDTQTILQRMPSVIKPASNDTEVATSLQDVAAALRAGMVARLNEVSVHYRVPESAYDGSQEATNVLIDEIFYAAVAHTGNGQEGDALLWVYNWFGGNVSYSYADGYCNLYLNLSLDYYTNAKQEAELTAAVEDALASFDFTQETSDYEMVKAVYDYVCANITYDYDNLYNDGYLLKYTAYAALVNGTAVCQGYAVLMYRFLLELGIDCRVVTGIGNGGPHAWNIVKLGDYYYNFDSTWDAGSTDYSYFLLNEENFEDHFRDAEYATEEFHAQYPMDTLDYDPESAQIPSHTHEYVAEVTAPTCTERGYTTYTCTICGRGYKGEWVEAVGHSYDEGVVTAPTCNKLGYTTYTCTLCAVTVIDDYVDMVPHEYTSEVIPPSCQNNGYTRYDCINCEWFYTDNYVPASHEYVEEVKQVTCTDFGYTTRTCTLCGDSYRIDYENPTGHTLDENFVCIVCGRPEYVLHSGLETKELVLGEDGVYYTPYGDAVFVAVKLQMSNHVLNDTLYHSVGVFGAPAYSLTYWEQILSCLNEDGCMLLTEERMAWILDLLKGEGGRGGQDDWGLCAYLCYVRDHNHEYETVTTPPTCSEWGAIEEMCIHCGFVTESERLSPKHSYDEGVVTPATCIRSGYTTYTCTACGYIYTTNFTDDGDHTYGEDATVVPPTCTSEGYTTYTCTLCGELVYTDFVPPIDHTPDASCICTVCGQKVYLVDIGLELDMLVLGEDGAYYTPYGDPVMIAISAPLDNWLGGYSLYDYVTEFGSYYFSMTHWKDLQTAVNEDGYAPLTQDTLVWMLDLITGNPAWGEDEDYLTYYLAFPVDHAHTYEVYEEAPTCVIAGMIVHTCTECGISVWEYTEPWGHSLDENFMCTVCGVKLDYVIDCGMELKDFILGEDGLRYTEDGYMGVIAIAAPLDGWLGGNSLADYVYVFGDTLFDLTWWGDLLEACNEDGYVVLTSYTLAWLESVITGNPASGQTSADLTHYIGYCVKCNHSYNEGMEVAPTCTEGGYTIYWCTFCGDSYTENETPALGHSYETVVTAPTCTTRGYTTYTCTVCGDRQVNDAVDATGHSYEAVVTAPTCTAGGYTTYTCASCGDSYTADFTDATSHQYADGQCIHCGAAEITVMPGDVNGDGKANTSDAKLIMQYELGLLELDEQALAAADVNGDGKVNTSDAKLIMQRELGLIPSPIG